MGLADDTRWLDATDQAALVTAGEVTATELVDAAIERIETLNPQLNAVVIPWFEQARAAASDALPDGPFRGVPFLVKDLYAHVDGGALTNGNEALAAELPISDYDTDLVARYRAAGLVFLGRSASSEFGSMPVVETDAFGATRNPWDPDRTPGGSSGGSGAAVAAGMVPIAHGSDGGGSIRIPASCCGLFGLKPSQGRITMAPVKTENVVGVEHVLTRSVRDSAAALDATHGAGVGDVIIAARPARPFVDEVGADPGRLRIGLLDHNLRGNDIDPEVVTAVRQAASMLEDLGHDVAPGHPEGLGDADAMAQYGMTLAPGVSIDARSIAERVGCEPDDVPLQPWNRVQAEIGRTLSATDLADAQAGTVQYRRRIQAWWEDGWDLLLTPTLAATPLPIGTLVADPADPLAVLYEAGAFVPFTPAFNVSGQPAVSLPLHWSDDGLPIGVQLVAAYGREDVLIRVSSQLEAAHPWADRRPPI